jgi:protein PhnA
VYADQTLWVCPECAHEWPQHELTPIANEPTEWIVRDASGNVLKDGDSVTVIKNLPVKGSSSPIKVGTKVKNIRLVDDGSDHNISCKIDGFGAMALKAEFVRKV